MARTTDLACQKALDLLLHRMYEEGRRSATLLVGEDVSRHLYTGPCPTKSKIFQGSPYIEIWNADFDLTSQSRGSQASNGLGDTQGGYGDSHMRSPMAKCWADAIVVGEDAKAMRTTRPVKWHQKHLVASRRKSSDEISPRRGQT